MKITKSQLNSTMLRKMVARQLQEAKPKDARLQFAKEVLSQMTNQPASVFDNGSAIQMMFGTKVHGGTGVGWEEGVKVAKVHMARDPSADGKTMGPAQAYMWYRGQKITDPAQAAAALDAYIEGGDKDEATAAPDTFGLQESKGNKMKITKTQLKRIIKEEFEAVTEEDAQGGFIRGAQGAGKDVISVDKIRISSDGSFKAKVSSAQLEKPLRVAGQLDHNSTALLQQAGALEKAKITPLQKELNDKLAEMISAYDGAEVPPPLSIMKGLFDDGKHEESKGEITDLWNKLLKYHQRTGTRLQHQITTIFNEINTLLRKMD